MVAIAHLVEPTRQPARRTMSREPQRVRLAISTCPNDTFAFHGLINRKVDWRGLDFEIQLLDIQQLNNLLWTDDFDVAKASFHAALHLSDSTVVLPSGSALGFGVGPLLLSATVGEQPKDASQLTLCPGKHTTAAMLFALFYPETTRVDHCVFSDIMPRLQANEANFGVCIHEGRFTWQQQGLGLVADLGTLWEESTSCPLPLGGILARRSLGPETIATVQAVISDSLEYGLANRPDTLPTMREHAQEFDDDVLIAHVDLYVNEWTRCLGEQGERALQVLSEKAKSIGLIGSNQPAIEVFKQS